MSKTNSEKKKKYTFLKRTKSKNNENNEKHVKKDMIFSQKKSKTKYQFDNTRINNENFHNTINDFYSRKENKLFFLIFHLKCHKGSTK